MFKHILEKADSFPDEVRNDPDKLLDYVRVSENAKERMESASENSPDNDVVASTLIGAKGDDYKSVGISSDSSTTLSAELAKKKASGQSGLNMQDMMKLMGV